jgi:protein TonB
LPHENFRSDPIRPRARDRCFQPEFPREADRAGVNDGKVKARMTIDASGEVTRVEVLEATPRRIFDREVVRALSQWRFAKGGDARAMEVDLEFRR